MVHEFVDHEILLRPSWLRDLVVRLRHVALCELLVNLEAAVLIFLVSFAIARAAAEAVVEFLLVIARFHFFDLFIHSAHASPSVGAGRVLLLCSLIVWHLDWVRVRPGGGFLLIQAIGGVTIVRK